MIEKQHAIQSTGREGKLHADLVNLLRSDEAVGAVLMPAEPTMPQTKPAAKPRADKPQAQKHKKRAPAGKRETA